MYHKLFDEALQRYNEKQTRTDRRIADYILSIFQNYIEMFDFEHSVDEDRYIAIGKVGDVLFVVFTERKETIRLISARLATNAEKELYYDQNINY